MRDPLTLLLLAIVLPWLGGVCIGVVASKDSRYSLLLGMAGTLLPVCGFACYMMMPK